VVAVLSTSRSVPRATLHPALTAQPPASSAPDTPEALYERYHDDYPGFVGYHFQKQAADPRRSGAVRNAVNDLIVDHRLERTTLQSVSCGATICRLMLVHEGAAAAEQFNHMAMFGREPVFDSGGTLTRVSTVGERETWVFYIGVDGHHPLPLVPWTSDEE
jgi:hypothetical protein